MFNLSKKDLTILAGNIIYHFDTSIYIFSAPLLTPLFFPNNDSLIGLIMVYGIMATSIVTVPIGTYIFSSLAKSRNSSYALSVALTGIGIAAFCVGILPEYYIIGGAAPILLILLRSIREVFAAGENTIGKLYILQDKTEKEAFKCSYLYQSSSMIGTILASTIATLLYYLELDHMWRLCFILGGCAVIPGYMLRKKQISVKNNNLFINPLSKFCISEEFNILCKHKLNLIRIAIVNSFSYMTYLIPFVTMNNVIPLITNIDIETMMALNSSLLFFDMIAIPVIGKIISKYNSQKIMILASTVLSISIFPLWYFLENSSLFYVTFVRLWIVIWGIIFLCPLNLWCKNQVLNEKERYIVVGMGSALSECIIGKLSPSLLLMILYFTGSYIFISVYVTIIFVTAGVIIKSRRWDTVDDISLLVKVKAE